MFGKDFRSFYEDADLELEEELAEDEASYTEDDSEEDGEITPYGGEEWLPEVTDPYEGEEETSLANDYDGGDLFETMANDTFVSSIGDDGDVEVASQTFEETPEEGTFEPDNFYRDLAEVTEAMEAEVDEAMENGDVELDEEDAELVEDPEEVAKERYEELDDAASDLEEAEESTEESDEDLEDEIEEEEEDEE